MQLKSIVNWLYTALNSRSQYPICFILYIFRFSSQNNLSSPTCPYCPCFIVLILPWLFNRCRKIPPRVLKYAQYQNQYCALQFIRLSAFVIVVWTYCFACIIIFTWQSSRPWKSRGNVFASIFHVKKKLTFSLENINTSPLMANKSMSENLVAPSRGHFLISPLAFWTIQF